MNHIKEIESMLNSVDLGQPVRILRLSSDKANLFSKDKAWVAKVSGNSFKHFLVKSYADRYVDVVDKVYKLNLYHSINQIRNHVDRYIIDIYKEVCNNKEPRRTSTFKKLTSMLRSCDDNSECFNTIFDICQYYYSVTVEAGLLISEDKNTVHRKNIYSLIKILEQKHGSKKIGN